MANVKGFGYKQTDTRTDRRTDEQTDVPKTICSRLIDAGT